MASSKDLINQNLAALAAADTRGQYDLASAKQQSDAQKYIAELQNRLGYFQTRQQTGLGRYQTDVGAQTQRYTTDVDAGTARYTSNNSLRGTLYGADAQERLGRYQSELGLKGTELQTGAERDIASGRLGFDYAKLGFQKDAFGRVLGFVNPLFASLSGSAGADAGIDVRPVYTNNQVNQQVASGRSQIAGQSALLQRQIAQGAAARGLGSQSPLVQALLANQGARAIGQGVDAERELRLSAAEKNAQQVLAAQQARAQAVTGRWGALASILGAGLGAL